MIGTLDSQVIEKFKEFQDKTGKYSDLKIEDVKFESKNLFDIVSLSNGSEFPSSYVKRTEVQGDIPLISAGTKVDIMGHIKTLKGNNISFPNKHYVFNNTKNKWNEVTHYTGKDYYTLTADGVYGGTLILRKMTDFPNGFYTTNVCKVLDFIDENVFEQYFLYAYNMEKQKHKFGFATKANNDNLQKVYIPTPKDYNEKYKSIDIQKAIVEFLEYSFDNLERIKSNIDKRYDIVTKMKKSLIPSTFKRTAIKNKFKEYAQENNIDFDITDIEFDIKRIHSKNKDEVICKKRMGFTPKTDNNGDINWFSVSDLTNQDGLYIDVPNSTKKTTMKLIKEQVDSNNTGKSEKLIPIKNGDILVSFKLTVGTVKIYNSDLPAYCNEAIDILTLNKNFDNRYVAYNCILEYPKNGNRTNNGITLNDDDKEKIKIFIPKDLQNYTSYKLQQILADFIEHIDNELEEKYFNKYNRAYEVVELLRDTYLKRTFNKIVWS